MTGTFDPEAPPNDKSVVIVVRGGLVVDVIGLPDELDYDVCDYDNCPTCGGRNPNCPDCHPDMDRAHEFVTVPTPDGPFPAVKVALPDGMTENDVADLDYEEILNTLFS